MRVADSCSEAHLTCRESGLDLLQTHLKTNQKYRLRQLSTVATLIDWFESVGKLSCRLDVVTEEGVRRWK